MLSLVMHLVTFPTNRNSTSMVGEVKETASDPDRQAIRHIQTKKPNPWFPLCGDIGPNIDLRKIRDSGERRNPPEGHPFHVKGYQSNPSDSVEGIQFEPRGNEGSDVLRGDLPVKKY